MTSPADRFKTLLMTFVTLANANRMSRRALTDLARSEGISDPETHLAALAVKFPSLVARFA